MRSIIQNHILLIDQPPSIVLSSLDKMAKILTLCIAFFAYCAIEVSTYDDWNFTKVEDGCWVDGVFYEFGDVIATPPQDPCRHCICVDWSDDHPTCAMASCAQPPCVDYEVIGSCCPSCPNGPNCQIGNEVVPHGEVVTLPMEDNLLCFEECQCYGGGHAGCRLVCQLPEMYDEEDLIPE